MLRILSSTFLTIQITLAFFYIANRSVLGDDSSQSKKVPIKSLASRLRINARLRIVTGGNDNCDYRVDEYIDVPNSRVAIRLQDEFTGQYTTYYRVGNNLDKITRYDETKQECQFEHDSLSWRLHTLSRLVALLPMMYQIKSGTKLKPTVIGTGSILYIVMTKLNSVLKFERRTFDDDRYIYLNYYSALFELNAESKKMHGLNSDLDVVLRILVGMASPDVLQEGSTLVDTSPSDKVPHFIMMDIVERSKIGLSNEGNFYGVLIDYYLTSKLDNVLANGWSYGELANPFILPLAMWCWDNHEANAYSLDIGSEQFSAIYYEETLGSTVIYYMAYDGKTKTLRYDKPGSKTIIDVKQFWAYHISKNTSDMQKNNHDHEQDQAISPSSINNNNKCSLIGMDLVTINNQYKNLARIIGFSAKEPVYLMGQAEIDGLDCYVFERHIEFIPRIFGYRPMETGLDYFLVVYIVHDNSLMGDESMQHRSIKSWPKRLSLISFNATTKRRKIEISLMFAQFSWSLQVPPEEEDSSSWLMRPVHLFDVDECAPLRRGRARLEFYLEQESEAAPKSDFLVESRWKTLMTRGQTKLQHWIMEHIVESYEISRARVTNLEVSFRQRAVLAKAILLEVPETHSERRPLGYYDKSPTTYMSFIEEPGMRIIHHISLEECHLEAASMRVNSMTYCPKFWGTCVLKELDASIVSSDKFIRGSTIDGSYCSVYTLHNIDNHNEYSMETLPRFLEDAETLLTKTPVIGQFRLAVDLTQEQPQTVGNRENSTNQNIDWIYYSYVAKVTSVKVTMLDVVNEVKAVDGLGYILWHTNDKHNDDANNQTNQPHMSQTHHVESINGPGENDDKVGLVYCQKACQFSDHCNSWSFCRTNMASWCKIADLELTQPVLESFYESTTRELVQGFLVQYPPGDGIVGDKHNYIYYLEKDRQCSLHSKDYFQLYQKNQIISVNIRPKHLKQFAFVSLDECARLCFSNELPSSENNSQGNSSSGQLCSSFEYCPIINLCHFDGLKEGGPDGAFFAEGISGDGNGAENAALLFKSLGLERYFDSDQQCQSYERNYDQYYTKQQFKRLSISDTEQIGGGQDIFSSDVETRLENIDLNECIRRCSLSSEQCLSFDYCRASMRPPHSTCVIYKIRSPSVMDGICNGGKNTKQLQELLTDIENKYYLGRQTNNATKSSYKYKIELRDQERCDHYALIDAYANIKLEMAKNRADMSKQIDAGQDSKDTQSNQESGDSSKDGTKTLGTNTNGQQRKSSSIITFIIGLAIGVTVYLTGPGIVTRWTDWRQMRAARASESMQSFRFSVLNLAQNEQLQQNIEAD